MTGCRPRPLLHSEGCFPATLAFSICWKQHRWMENLTADSLFFFFFFFVAEATKTQKKHKGKYGRCDFGSLNSSVIRTKHVSTGGIALPALESTKLSSKPEITLIFTDFHISIEL